MTQNRLKEIREARGLSQAALAEKLNTTSVSVGRYEREDQRLDLPLLSKLSRVLKCSIAQIAGEVPLELAEDAPDYQSPLDRKRLAAVVDALDHHLAEHKLRVAPGGRSDLIMAIYDWSAEQQVPIDELGDLSRIGPLLSLQLTK